VAVPKTLKLQVQPPSTTVLTPGGSGTQLMRILNPTGVCFLFNKNKFLFKFFFFFFFLQELVRLRLKVVFNANGQHYEDLDQVNNFPQL